MPDSLEALRLELAQLRTEMEGRFAELEKRLETRIDAAERQTDLHEQSDVAAFGALRRDLADLRSVVLETQSAHEADAMAQMHVLGLVARKVGVPPKALQKVRL